MLSVPHAVKIFVALAPTDMRKSHDGLAALVEHVLEADPLSGHLFVFRNKRADRVKLLFWDGDGYGLYYKKREAEHARNLVFPEFGVCAHNWCGGPVGAGRMAGDPRKSDSRRIPMSRRTEAGAPPRAENAGKRSRLANSGIC